MSEGKRSDLEHGYIIGSGQNDGQYTFAPHSSISTMSILDEASSQFCGIFLTILSVILIVVTFPLSMFFCIKVCIENGETRSIIYNNRWFKNTSEPLFSGWDAFPRVGPKDRASSLSFPASIPMPKWTWEQCPSMSRPKKSSQRIRWRSLLTPLFTTGFQMQPLPSPMWRIMGARLGFWLPPRFVMFWEQGTYRRFFRNESPSVTRCKVL